MDRCRRTSSVSQGNFNVDHVTKKQKKKHIKSGPLPENPVHEARSITKSRSITHPLALSGKKLEDLINILPPGSPEPLRASHVGDVNSRRNISPSNLNIGPNTSLEHETPLSADLNLNHTTNPAVEKLRQAIIDDHDMRIQSLYYQLLAYFDEGCTIVTDSTIIQHGLSTIANFSSAHFALLPRLKDNHLEILKEQIDANGLTPDVMKKMKIVGFKKAQVDALVSAPKKNREALIKQAFDTHQSSCLLGDKTYFYHSCNCTNQLPHYVNQFHQEIERELQPIALKLLNQTSKEGLDPYTGLTTICANLDTFLHECKAQTNEKLNLVNKAFPLEAKLYELQQKVRSESIENETDFLKEFLANGRGLQDIGIELEKLKGKSLPANTNHLKALFKFVNKYANNLKNPGKALSELKSIINEHFFETKFLELSSNLENCLVVISLLSKTPYPPPQGALSGTYADGKWIPYNKDQLLQQKYEIISNRIKVEWDRQKPSILKKAR